MSAQISKLFSPRMVAMLLAATVQAACGVSSTLLPSSGVAVNSNTPVAPGAVPPATEPSVAPPTTPPAPTGSDAVLGTVIDGKFVLSPLFEPGPYWNDNMPRRSDVTTDPGSGVAQDGAPMQLNLTVYQVADNKATPLEGAQVDLWQANAEGVFSAEFNQGTLGREWLRGYQESDGSGQVQFLSIVPGWYETRAPHVHIRVRDNQGFNWTTQLFFKDEDLAPVYAQAPYSDHTGQDTFLTDDRVYTINCGPRGGQYPCGKLAMLTVSQGNDGALVAQANLYLDLSDND